MVRLLVVLVLLPRLALADGGALVYEAKDVRARRAPKGVDVNTLITAAYPTAKAVDSLTNGASAVMFLQVLQLRLVTRAKGVWGTEAFVAVLGCVGKYIEREVGAARVRCTPEVTLLAEENGAWSQRVHVELARFAIDWEIAGGNNASAFIAADDYWPVAKQASALLEVGIARKVGDESSKETTALAVFWLEDSKLREVLSLSYTSAEQNERGRRDVVMTIAEYDDHATRGVPDIEVREQVTTFANGKERMNVRLFTYKWNGKKFVRAGTHKP